MPTISVVIPVYNGARTIVQALACVCAQSYADLEVIVIDDGSSDETVALVRSFQDARIQVHSFANAGSAVSRNRGIRRAAGEYIAFLDADDLWTKDKLLLQYEALRSNPYAAVAYSWTDYIDDKGEFLFPGDHIAISGNINEKLLVKNFIQSGSNILVRKDAFYRVGFFDESLRRVEDLEMFFRLSKMYDFVALARVQVFYRLREGSLSADLLPQARAQLAVVNRAFQDASPTVRRLKYATLFNLGLHFLARMVETALIRKKHSRLLKSAWCALRRHRFLHGVFHALTFRK